MPLPQAAVRTVKLLQVSYLESLGMPTQAVCHIIALTCKILDLDVEEDLKPVVEYIENQGVSSESACSALEVA